MPGALPAADASLPPVPSTTPTVQAARNPYGVGVDGPTAAAWVAIAVSAGLGGWGVRQAGRANTHAADSARAASEAVAVARAADERAARLERISLERRDVAWEQSWVTEPAETLTFLNVGTDRAHQVELVVDPDDAPRMTFALPYVDAQDRIGMRVTVLANEARATAPAKSQVPFIRVDARLTWRSEAGVPSVQAFDDLWLEC